jgi:hypothetical protein
MPRIERFTFVINEEEREMISLIAKELHRSDSDAVRFLIISKAKEIEGNYSADYLTNKDLPDVGSS